MALSRSQYQTRMCASKRQFWSRTEAENECIKRVRFFGAPGSLRAYRCPFCNGWHLTCKPLREATTDGKH